MFEMEPLIILYLLYNNLLNKDPELDKVLKQKQFHYLVALYFIAKSVKTTKKIVMYIVIYIALSETLFNPDHEYFILKAYCTARSFSSGLLS